MKKFILDEAKAKKKKNKTQYTSMSFTTGDIDYNIDMFNKQFGAIGGIETTDAAQTSQVDSDVDSAELNDSLTEEKRYVRRYYIKPINKFCSTKVDIIHYLIDNNDTDCVIYTLNNLTNNNDVTKLTSKDIIYYYEDGILYDKNHVKIMDYELAVKNEEEREKIDINTASDAEIKKVYSDRLIGKKYDESLDEETHAQFAKPAGDKINAYNNALKYAKKYNTPIIYGYTNLSQNNKFFALDEPIKCSANIKNCQNKFKNKYKNANVVYVAYPDQEFIDESLINSTFKFKLNEETDENNNICCICGKKYSGYGNNAEPYASGKCCDECNIKYVIPARLKDILKKE